MYTPSVADRIHGSAGLRRRQAVGRNLARALARIDVRGADTFPARGPVVLAANHRDFLDGPLLFGFTPRPVSFLVKIEAFTPRMTPVLTGAGQIPVNRDGLDVAAVRLSLRILRGGGAVGLFPEGSRGDGLVATARPGVGYFALRTGAPVIPVACHGTQHMVHRHGARRPTVSVTFGPPIDLGHVPYGQRVSRNRVLDATEHVRAILARLVAATSQPNPMRVAA